MTKREDIYKNKTLSQRIYLDYYFGEIDEVTDAISWGVSCGFIRGILFSCVCFVIFGVAL